MDALSLRSDVISSMQILSSQILELTKVLEEGDLWKYPTHDDVVKVPSPS